MRFKKAHYKCVAENPFSFNSLYEILNLKRLALKAAGTSSNSLYEIPAFWIMYLVISLYTSNSLYEIPPSSRRFLKTIPLPILFMRFKSTSAFTRWTLPNFQFSLWDSYFNNRYWKLEYLPILFMRFRVLLGYEEVRPPLSSNSLYEIQWGSSFSF